MVRGWKLIGKNDFVKTWPKALTGMAGDCDEW